MTATTSDAESHDETSASRQPPAPPDTLSGEAREIWAYTLAQLDSMRAIDRDWLACYCEAVVNHRRASAKLAMSDILIKGANGQPVRNPALAVQQQAAATIRAFAEILGPVARARRDAQPLKPPPGDTGWLSLFDE